MGLSLETYLLVLDKSTALELLSRCRVFAGRLSHTSTPPQLFQPKC